MTLLLPGVFRLQQNVLEQSSAGVIATFGDPLGRDGSWTAGTDFTYQTSRFQGNRNFLVGVWGLAMDRDGLTGRSHALGTKIDYPNDLWDIAFTYKWVGESFDPSLGFVQRPGSQLVTLNITNVPRPKRPIMGLRVRQMTNEWFNTVATDLDGSDAKQYGSWNQVRGNAARTLFVIGRDGRILWRNLKFAALNETAYTELAAEVAKARK